MIWDIGLGAADLPEDLWHLAQEIKHFAVGFLQVNPETVQGNDSIVGEAAAPEGGGFTLTTNSILATVTAFFVK